MSLGTKAHFEPVDVADGLVRGHIPVEHDVAGRYTEVRNLAVGSDFTALKQQAGSEVASTGETGPPRGRSDRNAFVVGIKEGDPVGQPRGTDHEEMGAVAP